MASSTVQSLSVTGEGIYFRLCLIQWEDGQLPDDENVLMRLSRSTETEWLSFGYVLDKCFPKCDDGFRRNVRICDQRNLTFAKVLKNKENGFKGGRPKKPGSKNPNKSERLAKRKPNESQTKANKEPEPEVNISFFEEVKREYPLRDGDYGWSKARTKIMGIALTERPNVIAGIIGYREYLTRTEKIGTTFVKQAPTFFNQETWTEFLNIQTPQRKRELHEDQI